MTIKLSDYILEQTISDASVDDIMIEQAIAEVEVASAMLEAYFKQVDMYGEGFFQESLESELEAAQKKDAADASDVQSGENQLRRDAERLTNLRRMQAAMDAVPTEPRPDDGKPDTRTAADAVADRIIDQQATDGSTAKLRAIGERGVANFFKAIGNWFVKIWTKFMGWVTEKRMESIIKKLDKIGPDKRKSMKVMVPSNVANQNERLVVDAFSTGEDFLNILTQMKSITQLKGPDAGNINTILDEVETFRAGLHTKLKKKRLDIKTSGDNIVNDKGVIYGMVESNGEELKSFLQKELDSYRKNKQHVEELRNSLKQNKNIGEEIAKKFTGTDDKSGKRIYRAIKKIYDMYSTYMANQLRIELQLLDPSKIKEAMKSAGGSSSNSGDTTAKKKDDTAETAAKPAEGTPEKKEETTEES